MSLSIRIRLSSTTSNGQVVSQTAVRQGLVRSDRGWRQSKATSTAEALLSIATSASRCRHVAIPFVLYWSLCTVLVPSTQRIELWAWAGADDCVLRRKRERALHELLYSSRRYLRVYAVLTQRQTCHPHSFLSPPPNPRKSS